ncbi:MAG: hypothetical protein ACI38A_09605, partial [Candidatus Ornithomonoglobus sp.]
TGTAFKYTASADGYLSAYVTNLGDTKVCYITPEGAESRDDCIGSVSGADGSEQAAVAPVEKGKTYYIFVAGSKGRFTKISFTTDPQEIIWTPSADVEAGTGFAKGITASEKMTYIEKAGGRDIDGIVFNGCIQGTTNPGGSPKGETGAALKYAAYANGNLTVYYKIGSTKVFKITDADGNIIASYENEAEYADDDTEHTTNIGESQYTSTTAEIYAGKTYYIYVDGSKAEFYGVSFEQTGAAENALEASTPDPNAAPTPKPTASPTPKPTEVPTPAPVYWKASKSVTTSDTLMTGLTAGEAMEYTEGVKEIDGVSFTGYVAGVTNPSFADGILSGAGLIFTAPANGTFTAYMEVNEGKTFKITDSDNKDIVTYTPTEKGQYSISAEVTAGQTYYAYVGGSRPRIYGAKFAQSAETAATEPTINPTEQPPEESSNQTEIEGTLSDSKVTVTAYGNEGDDVYAAQYDADGRLIRVVKKIPGTFDIEIQEDTARLAVFVWNGNEPLCAMTELR